MPLTLAIALKEPGGRIVEKQPILRVTGFFAGASGRCNAGKCGYGGIQGSAP
jgi:hypothetical protein